MDPVLWNEALCEAIEKEYCPYISVVDDETDEVILRTIFSVNQLSVYGAEADVCDELAWRISGCSESTGKLVAQKKSETPLMPTELSTRRNPPRTNEKVQGNLLRVYERQFANLPDPLQLIKLCFNAGIVKTVTKGQYFTTHRRCGT